MAERPTEVVVAVVGLLDGLGIPYYVGGSVAAAAYGEPRTTADVDIVVSLGPDQIEPLARALEKDFYVSREAMREAVRDRRSFNAIHLATVSKVDVFVLGNDPFDQEEFRRRVPRDLPGAEGASVVFKTAEDTVLRKLQWYRLGGEVSEQQWRDVLGVLIVSRDHLDNAYMDRWAAHLGVSDLLEKARGETRGV